MADKNIPITMADDITRGQSIATTFGCRDYGIVVVTFKSVVATMMSVVATIKSVDGFHSI